MSLRELEAKELKNILGEFTWESIPFNRGEALITYIIEKCHSAYAAGVQDAEDLNAELAAGEDI